MFAHLVFPIAMQVGMIIPTLQMRKLRLGEESSDLRPPSQEMMEQDSAPGLREGCMQVLGGDRKWWGTTIMPRNKLQCHWWRACSVTGSNQAFHRLRAVEAS